MYSLTLESLLSEEMAHEARPLKEILDISTDRKHTKRTLMSDQSSPHRGTVAHEIYSLSGTAEATIGLTRNARVSQDIESTHLISGLLEEQTKRGVCRSSAIRRQHSDTQLSTTASS